MEASMSGSEITHRSKRMTRKTAALILFAFGLVVAATAFSYELGTLRRMGPGYFPLMLGGVLCVLAVALLFEPSAAEAPNEPANEPASEPATDEMRFRTRALLFPILGILAFAVLIELAGFVPAIFVSLFLTGLADHDNSWIELVMIAVLVAIITSAIFVYGLGTPVRLFAL